MKTPTCKMSPLGEVVGGAVVAYRGSGGDTLALVLKPVRAAETFPNGDVNERRIL